MYFVLLLIAIVCIWKISYAKIWNADYLSKEKQKQLMVYSRECFGVTIIMAVIFQKLTKKLDLLVIG